MMRNWLIPGGAGAVAGAAIVLLVRGGLVETKDKDGVLRPVPPDEPLVVEIPATRPVEDDDAARRLARAERRIAELEKRLNAAHEESARLGAELVQKKGITLADLAARFEELKGGTGMTAFLPGKTAGLIADLKGLGPAGTQALVDLLKSKDKDDRTIAAKLLEDLKDPAAIPALKDVALNDEDELAAKMAGHAIALMEDPRAIEPLREILEKKRSWESEVNALWGLVHLGDQRGLEQAIAYMDDGKVGKQPRAALGANVAVFMPYPEVMPIVDATVRDFFASGHVMEIAINYYKAVGNAPARDRLQAISTDARLDAETREAARQALIR
jgi:HEAT repeat protein